MKADITDTSLISIINDQMVEIQSGKIESQDSVIVFSYF